MRTDHAALYRELLPLLHSPNPADTAGNVLSFCPAHDDGAKHRMRGGRSLSLHPDKGLWCFAGCSFAAVLAAFGLNPNGQYEPRTTSPPGHRATNPVAAATKGVADSASPVRIYEYRDETGALRGVKARFETPEGKTFKWRKPGAGGWPNPSGITVAEMPLWGAELVAAADPQTEVLYVEGEQCVEASRAQGLLAVTAGGGAGQRDFGDALEVLRGRDVLLWPDNDPGGRDYMRRVEGLLRPIARSVRYAVPAAALPVGGDAADYFATGGTWADMAAGLLREPVAEPLADDVIRVRVPTPAGPVTLTFSAIEVSRRAVDAELAVTFPLAPSELAYEERINLLSSSQRESLRRTLDALYGKDFAWMRVIETATPLVRGTLRQMERDFDMMSVGEPVSEGFLIDTLVPYGHPTILFGEGAAAKSYLAVVLAMAVSRGTPFLRFVSQRGPVLYMDYESTAQTLRFRLGRVAWGLGLADAEVGMVRYWPARGIPLCEQTDALRQAIARHGIRLLIVDSVGAACGGEPEKSDVALRFFGALASLRVTSLLIAHITKAGDTRSPLGSVYWGNYARRAWYVERVQEEDSDQIKLGLFCRKVNDGRVPRPFGLTVTFEGEAGPVRFEAADIRDTPALQARRGAKAQIIDVLRQGAKTASEIADETDLDVETVRRTLNRTPSAFRRIVISGGGRGAQTQWGLATRA